MGISQFPPAASGGGLSNDFILDRANTNNTTFQLPREFEAGGYALVTSTNDSTFDVYLLNAAGSSVGYTNGSSIVATEAFDTVVAYGLSTAATVQFQYRGPSTNATSTGLETGAGAFLTSIFPADLPNIDDTATVAGGNFGTGVAITFESGTVVLPAKNVVVGSSTALVVTRPDSLIQDNSPYTLRAVNPGITQPTGSNANLLVGTVTAGQDPAFVTPALITGAEPNVAFSTSILTSDADGTVVNWTVTAGTVPTGLSLATATGALSGTPTVAGDYYFTVRITDDGGNTNSREFNLPVGFQLTGGNSTVVGGTTYAWWTTSGTAIYKNASSKNVEYIVIAGGGGGGNRVDNNGSFMGGGGGAGGLLFGTATLSGAGTAAVTVGAGGSSRAAGNNSLVSFFGTAFAGGFGGNGGRTTGENGGNGGSGGGSGASFDGGASGGAGTAGQGNSGASNQWQDGSGGGGGAGSAAPNRNRIGGTGRQFGAWASAINIVYNAGFFAGGGAGCIGGDTTAYQGGSGGGGNSSGNLANHPTVGSANSGGGGGGGGAQNSNQNGANGGSGLVIARFS